MRLLDDPSEFLAHAIGFEWPGKDQSDESGMPRDFVRHRVYDEMDRRVVPASLANAADVQSGSGDMENSWKWSWWEM